MGTVANFVFVLLVVVDATVVLAVVDCSNFGLIVVNGVVASLQHWIIVLSNRGSKPKTLSQSSLSLASKPIVHASQHSYKSKILSFILRF